MSSKKITCFLLAALLLTSLFPVWVQPASAAGSAEIRTELNDLKSQNAALQAQIDAIQGQYDANASEIKALVDKKNAIDQEVALLHTQVLNLNEQIRVYSQLIADSQDELDEAQENWDEMNRQHILRVRAMEEEGPVTYWQVIFQSRSIIDFLDRVNMIAEIAEADTRRLEELRMAADVVHAHQADLADEKSGLEETIGLLGDIETALTERRNESDDVLRQLIDKREEFQSLLDESEALQDYLMREIALKQKELQQAQYKEELVKKALQGQNPPSNATWLTPVSGYTITSPFGMRIHPVYGYALMHNGIDLACPQGTPIYATRSGTVTTAAYQAGGAGHYVSINHGDGFASIYMHMTHYVVSAGQAVSQGQLIGYVGSTGVSTGPHLHFGVSYGGVYVNPMAYI